jgi:hypothetical protein
MKLNKRIRAVITATIGASLLAALAVSPAFAESPPSPPARFVGTVTVNGAPAAAGTTVEAKIGSTTCGVTSVFMSGAEARYTLDSPALDPAATPNCGTDGAAVTFFVGGQQAAETGSWKNYQLNTVNLTVGAATPTVTTTSTPGTTATATTTPRGPAAGSAGPSTSSSSSAWFIAAAAAIVVSASAGTLALARKRN